MIPFIIIFIFLMLFLFLFLRIREKFQSKKPIYDVEVYGKDFPQCVVNCSKFNDLDTPKLNNADTKKKNDCWVSNGSNAKICNECEYKCLKCNNPVRCPWSEVINDKKDYISGGIRTQFKCYENHIPETPNFDIKIDSFLANQSDGKILTILKWSIVGDISNINNDNMQPSFVIILIPKRKLESNNYSYKNVWLKYIPVLNKNLNSKQEGEKMLYTYNIPHKDMDGYALKLNETYVLSINMKLNDNIDPLPIITNYVSNSTEVILKTKKYKPINGVNIQKFEKIDSNKILNEILGKTFEISI